MAGSIPTPHGTVLARRAFLTGAVGVGATALLAACTTPGTGGSTGGPSTTGDSFPVTVTHRYGTTTVPAKPQRVIALGQTDLDSLVALGVVPIAIGGFAGDWYTAMHPWNEGEFAEEPELLDMEEFDFERIATLAPDLITCVLSGLSQADYDKLSQICPVIAQPEGFGDWAVPYDAQTLIIGEALAESAKAKALVAETEGRLAAVRDAHPEFADMRAAVAQRFGTTYEIIGATAPRADFFAQIGFGFVPELVDLVGDGYASEISPEKLSLLGDLDVVLWTTGEDEVADFLNDPVVAKLPSMSEGRSIVTTDGASDHLFWALDWGSILSTAYAIDHAVPQVLLAVDGDPATAPELPAA